MKNKSCSFFGVQEIEITTELKEKIRIKIDTLIKEHNVQTFYFGGFGKFEDYCHSVISEIKKQNKTLKRIFLTNKKIDTNYFKLPKWINNETYEEIVALGYSKRIDKMGQKMINLKLEAINKSDYVLFYFDFDTKCEEFELLLIQALKKEKVIFSISK